MENLAMYCLKKIVETPHLAKEINDLFVLCKDEVEAGKSEYNEIELCKSSIEELVESKVKAVL